MSKLLFSERQMWDVEQVRLKQHGTLGAGVLAATFGGATWWCHQTGAAGGSLAFTFAVVFGIIALVLCVMTTVIGYELYAWRDDRGELVAWVQLKSRSAQYPEGTLVLPLSGMLRGRTSFLPFSTNWRFSRKDFSKVTRWDASDGTQQVRHRLNLWVHLGNRERFELDLETFFEWCDEYPGIFSSGGVPEIIRALRGEKLHLITAHADLCGALKKEREERERERAQLQQHLRYATGCMVEAADQLACKATFGRSEPARVLRGGLLSAALKLPNELIADPDRLERQRKMVQEGLVKSRARTKARQRAPR